MQLRLRQLRYASFPEPTAISSIRELHWSGTCRQIRPAVSHRPAQSPRSPGGQESDNAMVMPHSVVLDNLI